MKKVLTSIFLSLSILSFSQTEQDYRVFQLLNQERVDRKLPTFTLKENYKDFDYYINYSLRVDTASEKEVNRYIGQVNNFIDVYYTDADMVYYAGVSNKTQPTPKSLLNTLIQNSNFPVIDCYNNYALTKMFYYKLGDRWVSFIYILTFR